MSHNNHTPACMHAVSRQDMHCHYQPDMLCQSAFAEAGPYLHGKQAVLLWTLQPVTYNRVCKYRSTVTGSRSANCFKNDNALLVGAMLCGMDLLNTTGCHVVGVALGAQGASMTHVVATETAAPGRASAHTSASQHMMTPSTFTVTTTCCWATLEWQL